MNLNMLYKFVEQHEGKFPWTDGFSPEQRVAMSAFASWLDEQVAQHSVQADKCQVSENGKHEWVGGALSARCYWCGTKGGDTK